ncbi:unnamed protein product, partial [Trichogramma brassicae]
MKKRSLAGNVGIGIFSVGFICICVAFFTSSWVVSDPRITNSRLETIGLWRQCFKSLPDPVRADAPKRYFAGCRWVYDPFTTGYSELIGFLLPHETFTCNWKKSLLNIHASLPMSGHLPAVDDPELIVIFRCLRFTKERVWHKLSCRLSRLRLTTSSRTISWSRSGTRSTIKHILCFTLLASNCVASCMISSSDRQRVDLTRERVVPNVAGACGTYDLDSRVRFRTGLIVGIREAVSRTGSPRVDLCAATDCRLFLACRVYGPTARARRGAILDQGDDKRPATARACATNVSTSRVPGPLNACAIASCMTECVIAIALLRALLMTQATNKSNYLWFDQIENAFFISISTDSLFKFFGYLLILYVRVFTRHREPKYKQNSQFCNRSMDPPLPSFSQNSPKMKTLLIYITKENKQRKLFKKDNDNTSCKLGRGSTLGDHEIAPIGVSFFPHAGENGTFGPRYKTVISINTNCFISILCFTLLASNCVASCMISSSDRQRVDLTRERVVPNVAGACGTYDLDSRVRFRTGLIVGIREAVSRTGSPRVDLCAATDCRLFLACRVYGPTARARRGAILDQGDDKRPATARACATNVSTSRVPGPLNACAIASCMTECVIAIALLRALLMTQATNKSNYLWFDQIENAFFISISTDSLFKFFGYLLILYVRVFTRHREPKYKQNSQFCNRSMDPPLPSFSQNSPKMKTLLIYITKENKQRKLFKKDNDNTSCKLGRGSTLGDHEIAPIGVSFFPHAGENGTFGPRYKTVISINTNCFISILCFTLLASNCVASCMISSSDRQRVDLTRERVVPNVAGACGTYDLDSRVRFRTGLIVGIREAVSRTGSPRVDLCAATDCRLFLACRVYGPTARARRGAILDQGDDKRPATARACATNVSTSRVPGPLNACAIASCMTECVIAIALLRALLMTQATNKSNYLWFDQIENAFFISISTDSLFKFFGYLLILYVRVFTRHREPKYKQNSQFCNRSMDPPLPSFSQNSPKMKTLLIYITKENKQRKLFKKDNDNTSCKLGRGSTLGDHEIAPIGVSFFPHAGENGTFGPRYKTVISINTNCFISILCFTLLASNCVASCMISSSDRQRVDLTRERVVPNVAGACGTYDLDSRVRFRTGLIVGIREAVSRTGSPRVDLCAATDCRLFLACRVYGPTARARRGAILDQGDDKRPATARACATNVSTSRVPGPLNACAIASCMTECVIAIALLRALLMTQATNKSNYLWFDQIENAFFISISTDSLFKFFGYLLILYVRVFTRHREPKYKQNSQFCNRSMDPPLPSFSQNSPKMKTLLIYITKENKQRKLFKKDNDNTSCKLGRGSTLGDHEIAPIGVSFFPHAGENGTFGPR